VPAVAVKEAVVAAAATVTLVGAVRLALLLVKLTAEPPVGAAPLKVTVQVLVPGPVNEAGLQARALTLKVTGATSEIAEVALAPLAVAVSVAVELVEIVPAVAVNVPVVAEAGMVIEAGAVSRALLLVMETVRPPVAAAALAVTMHALVAPEVKDVGVQISEVTVTSGDKLMEAVLEVPLSVAVMTAV